MSEQKNDNHLDMDAMIVRIQKLLALADPNSNDSQHQIEAATAAMEQYKHQYKQQRINPMLLRGDGHPWVWRRNWLTGAVNAISTRLYNMRKQEQAQQAADKSQALVVLDNAIQDYLSKTRPKLKTLGANSMYSSNYGNGYHEGHAAGNSMPIQQGVGGGSATAALAGK